MTEREPVLEAQHIEKYFSVGGGLRRKMLRALCDVSFQLHRREVVALVGESGSGKSTIAKVVARLEQPSSGRLLFKGVNMLEKEPRAASLEYRSQVQMIFQDPFGSLNPIHTVRYHLSRPLIRHRRATTPAEVDERVLGLLDTVGLTPGEDFADKRPHQMSGGQRQRVAIARALAVDPDVILADEPISMLDVSIRMGVLNLMEKLKDEHDIAYLYITHDIASARYIGDRTLVMYAGHIVEEAPSDELIEHPAHPYTQLLLSAVPDPAGSIVSDIPAKSGTPELIEPPPGCPFVERCPEAMSVCRKDDPGVTDLGQGHLVRCHLHGAAREASKAEIARGDEVREDEERSPLEDSLVAGEPDVGGAAPAASKRSGTAMVGMTHGLQDLIEPWQVLRRLTAT